MSNGRQGVLKVGTSGIAIPGSKDSFPLEFKEKSRLTYYASLFNTLEINSTFKKIPMLSTFTKWAMEGPDNFSFSIKLWKEITHVKKLEVNLDNVNTFLAAANHIGDKKDCLLIQFPGSITAEYHNQVKNILQRLQKLDSKNEWRKAVEFRSTTWYIPKTFKLLEKHNASMVLQDMPKSKNLHIEQDASFYYFRFHGPEGDYRGSYSPEFLHDQAATISKLMKQGKDVYAYFNNTMGDAFSNAMSLQGMVEGMSS